jgi:hypothetical protein
MSQRNSSPDCGPRTSNCARCSNRRCRAASSAQREVAGSSGRIVTCFLAFEGEGYVHRSERSYHERHPLGRILLISSRIRRHSPPQTLPFRDTDRKLANFAFRQRLIEISRNGKLPRAQAVWSPLRVDYRQRPNLRVRALAAYDKEGLARLNATQKLGDRSEYPVR